MSEARPPREPEWTRLLRHHLTSLRAAGIEWVPCAPAPEAVPAEPASPARSTLSGDEVSNAGIVSPALDPAAPVEERRVALQLLAQKVGGCTRCPELVATRRQTVFGVGKVGTELCFVGEAPGADEDIQGEPFVGAAGQLLNKIIEACKFKRDEVYICNIIKCRPPGNRTPLPHECANCREYLIEQLELVRPRFICALGSTAAHNLLQTSAPMGKLRGRFHDYRGIPVLCTYHPAYLLPHRSPEKKKDVWDDMKMLLARMGRPVGSAR